MESEGDQINSKQASKRDTTLKRENLGEIYHDSIVTLTLLWSGLIPTIFGGWKNGSLASIEKLNYVFFFEPFFRLIAAIV